MPGGADAYPAYGLQALSRNVGPASLRRRAQYRHRRAALTLTRPANYKY